MTKLSDTQLVILSAAAQREDRNVLPLPGSLRGGAAAKVVGALLKRGLIAETTTDSRTKGPTPPSTASGATTRTAAPSSCTSPTRGLAAIGVESEGGDSAPTCADAAPSAEGPEERSRRGRRCAQGAHAAHGAPSRRS